MSDRAWPADGREKKVLGLMSLMLVAWIASSWIRAIDTTMVAIAGAVDVPSRHQPADLAEGAAQHRLGRLDADRRVTSLGAAAGGTGLAKCWLARCPTCSCGRWRW